MSHSLCIDLGASFTKVAYRSETAAQAALLQDPELLDEHHFCVPSVAARNRATDAWVFGPDAADLRSGARVEVHDNWKADLFGEQADIDLQILEGADPQTQALLRERVPALRALEVATRFLQWLHDEQIPRMLGQKVIGDAQVSLCVPDFVLDSPLAPRLEQIMRSVGFMNDGTITLSEPKANLIGVLTEGRNPRTRAGAPNLPAMFGDTRVLRALAQPDQAVLLIDIGAFTTDLALASLVHHEGGAFEEDPATSCRLGIRLLDARILDSASPEERARVEGSPAEREHFHAAVHGGIGPARPEEYGLTHAAVEAAVEQFTSEILDAVDGFLASSDEVRVLSAVLTGGGVNVVGIGSRLAAGMAARGVQAVHAPTSTDAPSAVRKYALGPEIVRGASAIGGCSILYG